MSSDTHIDLIPSKNIADAAEEVTNSKAKRKGDPLFFMTEEMQKLSTPWSISSIRAGQIDIKNLPAGVILDAAAGSGVQLIAFSMGLKRPALGIEIDKEIAKLCAANMYINADKNDVQRTMDRVLIGDGTKSEEAMDAFWKSLRNAGTRAHPPIAMLHLDPARPRDAQNHHIDEMQPSLKNLLSSWSKFLQVGPRGPAVLLDLSPRLDGQQRNMVDSILETVFPGVPLTWEWLSQGGGRVDRLSVWVGSISSKSSHRCIRVGRKNIMAKIEGLPNKSELVELSKPPPFGSWISIIDASLIESGLQEAWLKNIIPPGCGHSWLRLKGRRPLLIHTEPLLEHENSNDFVVCSGKVVQHRLSAPELRTVDQVAAAALRYEINKVTLRCNMDPEMHPKIQRKLDFELKGKEGSKAFMIDIDLDRGQSSHPLYIVCKEDN